MARTRPVARLTGDAELGHARVDDLRVDWLRSERRVELRPAVGRVARDTRAVPVASLREQRFARRMQDGGTARDPTLLGDEIRPWQLTEESILTGGVPVNLLVMRAGDHHNLSRDARTRGPARACLAGAPIRFRRAKAGRVRPTGPTPRGDRRVRVHPVWIIKCGPEFVAAALERHRPA